MLRVYQKLEMSSKDKLKTHGKPLIVGEQGRLCIDLYATTM